MEEEPPLDYSEDPEIEVAPVSTTSSIDVRSILKASATEYQLNASLGKLELS